MRNHFNKFNQLTFDKNAFINAGGKVTADPATQGFEDGLNEMIPEFQKMGFQGIVFKPFMGGDNLSSHRYWTADPYLLNDTFRNKQSFRQSLDLMLKSGMKVFADGAFVNQGMNGVQVLSNVHNKTLSPYWNWFHFSNHQDGPRTGYPSLAHEGYEFGLLPTKNNAKGNPEIDYSAFAFRFINDPDGEDMYGRKYDKSKPTFIELYDPRLEDEKGNQRLPKDQQVSQHELSSSKRSVQKYRFPVKATELSDKRKESTEGLPLQVTVDKNGEKKATPITNARYLDWGNFRLTVPGVDNSSKKWDGQIDVALMNTQNEQVVDYLKNAVGYWSNMVMNHYTGSVAEKMFEAQQKLGKNAKPEDILRAVTQGENSPLANHPGLQVLPPISKVDKELGIVLPTESAQPNYEQKDVGAKFAETLIKNVPLNTLQLPVLFKANLNQETFLDALNKPRTGLSGFIENQVLTPMAKLPVVGQPVQSLSDWVFPPMLQKAIGRKMQQIFEEVGSDGATAEKLRHQRIQDIVADQLGERLYVSLLTGKSLKTADALLSDPQKLEDAVYEGLPPSLINASPQEAARRLPALLRQRLKEMNKPQAEGQASLQVQVREEVGRITRKLDPDLVNMASEVLNQREFGLNWRLDAAKDVANIDHVRNAPNDEEKLRRFEKEIKYLKDFWGDKMKSAMREPFPNASVIAELTDFDELAGYSNGGMGDKLKKSLFEDNTFTSTPNMSHTYSPLSQLVHYAQRPDEFGANTLAPSEFMKEHVLPMTQEVPLLAQRQLQNLSSSHDFSTTSHAMLLNPELFNMDRQKANGLVEFFNVAADDIATGQSFKTQREALKKAGFEDPKAVLDGLKNWLNHENTDGHVPGQLRALATKDPKYSLLDAFYNQKTKNSYTKQDATQKEKNLYIATPLDAKSRFVEALFTPEILPAKLQEEAGSVSYSGAGQIKGHELYPLGKALRGKTPEQQQQMLGALSEVLSGRMTESSEARAMRAAISTAVTEASKTNRELQSEQVKAAIWKGLDQAITRWGSHFGYQGLDVALNHVFESVQKEIEKTVGFEKTEQLKVDIYNKALEPVMAKQERIFAIQNALPGNPSVYLPDLFVQGGSEYIKNIYVQNRPVTRTDRLDDPKFKDYHDNVANIFSSRAQLPVLNDGLVLPLDNMEDADKQGILPIIRDNGEQQAIVLVDTGKPGENTKSRENMERKLYPLNPNGQATNPDANREFTSLNLKSAHLIPGTMYKDLNSGEFFRLDNDFNLKPANASGNLTNGKVKLKASRILVRQA